MSNFNFIVFVSLVIIILIIILSMFVHYKAYGDVPWSEIPQEIEVNFNVKYPNIALIQHDYCVSLSAYDDRNNYHENFKGIGSLHNAEVSIEIFPSHQYDIIAEIDGKTNKNGYFAGCTFVTTHSYLSHGLYTLTMSVSYDNSTMTKGYQFWTIEK